MERPREGLIKCGICRKHWTTSHSGVCEFCTPYLVDEPHPHRPLGAIHRHGRGEPQRLSQIVQERHDQEEMGMPESERTPWPWGGSAA